MGAADSPASSAYTARNNQKLNLVHDMLAPDEARSPVSRYDLAGGGTDDPVELPEEVYSVLRQAVEAMQRGLSVTISPTSQALTTQQAADLLGISRSALIKALDDGKLPYRRAGTHRRLSLSDVLNHREERRNAQYAAIEALSADVDEASDITEVLRDLRAARKAVAAKRKSG